MALCCDRVTCKGKIKAGFGNPKLGFSKIHEMNNDALIVTVRVLDTRPSFGSAIVKWVFLKEN